MPETPCAGGRRLGERVGAPAALSLLGFATAFYELGTKSIWLDEAVSITYARGSMAELWQVASRSDPNMGLYYLLLHVWIRLFGESEAAVRSLSACCAGLAVGATTVLGTRLFGRRAGVLAGLLLALDGFFVEYAQTARAYTLVVLLVTLSSLWFVTELERPTRASAVGYVLASVLSVTAHYFAVFVLLVQLSTVLVLRKRAAFTRRWLTLGGLILVGVIPEAVFASRAGTQNISWISRPTFGQLVSLPASLTGGSGLLALVVPLPSVVSRSPSGCSLAAPERPGLGGWASSRPGCCFRSG